MKNHQVVISTQVPADMPHRVVRVLVPAEDMDVVGAPAGAAAERRGDPGRLPARTGGGSDPRPQPPPRESRHGNRRGSARGR